MPSKLLWIVTLASGLAPAQPLPKLQARVEQLQSRIENTESIRAIKRLQTAYGHYVEFGLWNDFADLFTDDAVTNYQQGARGREQVRKLFFDQVGQGKLGLADGRIYPHILFQPVITLAPGGRTAKGRWRILAMLGGMGGSATWYSGVYENEYVLENGVWKISVLRSEPKATAAYTAAGWKDSGTSIPLHYTAASVSHPVPDGAVQAGAAASLAVLSEQVKQLEQRTARLNDQAAVTNVLDSYGDTVDGKLWNQAADLFAANGTLELGLQGVYVGKARIGKALEQLSPQGLNDHVYLQTLVTVDGRVAKARGVEFIFSSANGGELSEGVFENTFVKEPGGWKIQSVHFYPRMIVDAATGWGKSAKAAPGLSSSLPPDRPPTAAYGIYPKFSVPPFHFDNPATGKPPQYPDGVLSRTATVSAPVASREIKTAAELNTRLAAVERGMVAAETYDVAENLVHANGYSLDGTASLSGGTLFVSQVLQPVIDVAADGKSAKVRARRLDLSGVSGAAGNWTAGVIEGKMISEGGAWRLIDTPSAPLWTAPYPGGWGRLR